MEKQEYLQHLAITSNMLWKLIKENGHDPDSVFRKAGINPADLSNPKSRVACSRINYIWECAARLIDDPCFSIDISKHWHPSYLHALGYSWLAGKTLADSLERFARYSKMISDTLSLKLNKEYGEYTVTLHYHPDSVMHPLRRIATLSVLVEMCRLNAGPDLHPLRMTFQHTYPSCLKRFSDHFQSEIKFGEQEDSITYPSTDIFRELPTSNPHLAELNDKVILEYLEELNQNDMIYQVRSSILKVLSTGKVTDDHVAKGLNMSVRTLQRKLQQERTTFRTLLDQTRRDLAEKYIQDAATRLEEIAFLTGFSEYSSFSRAFKRWTTLSPSQFREQNP